MNNGKKAHPICSCKSPLPFLKLLRSPLRHPSFPARCELLPNYPGLHGRLFQIFCYYLPVPYPMMPRPIFIFEKISNYLVIWYDQFKYNFNTSPIFSAMDATSFLNVSMSSVIFLELFVTLLYIEIRSLP